MILTKNPHKDMTAFFIVSDDDCEKYTMRNKITKKASIWFFSCQNEERKIIEWKRKWFMPLNDYYYIRSIKSTLLDDKLRLYWV